MIDNTTSEQHAAEWFFKELRHTAAARRSINLRAAEFYALTTEEQITYFNTVFAKYHAAAGEPMHSTEEGADCLRKFWNN